MRKLSNITISLLKSGVNTFGSYDPNEFMFMIEEQLLLNEYHYIEGFMAWIFKNDRKLGADKMWTDAYEEFKLTPEFIECDTQSKSLMANFS